jgi:hypothetical protein
VTFLPSAGQSQSTVERFLWICSRQWLSRLVSPVTLSSFPHSFFLTSFPHCFFFFLPATRIVSLLIPLLHLLPLHLFLQSSTLSTHETLNPRFCGSRNSSPFRAFTLAVLVSRTTRATSTCRNYSLRPVTHAASRPQCLN